MYSTQIFDRENKERVAHADFWKTLQFFNLAAELDRVRERERNCTYRPRRERMGTGREERSERD